MAAGFGDDELLSDDRLWDRVWERMLSPVERHSIAVAVWLRRPLRDVFEARIAVQLAVRWRRQARNLALVYALWAGFWGLIAVSDWRSDGDWESLLCPILSTLGVAAVAACVAVRARLRPGSASPPGLGPRQR